MNLPLNQALAGVMRSAESLTINRLAAEVSALKHERDAVKRENAALNAELDEAAATTELYLDQLQYSMDANMRKRAHLKKLTDALARHRRPWWHKFLDLFQGAPQW
ncbi:hypothetical protein [Achromobacter mucicolens]|uniref:hypothetical protein n=1 Tax=Achromobacter mucicolens TaxID=1389922 RepID=UPI002FE402FC